jgi:hypothetical protein
MRRPIIPISPHFTGTQTCRLPLLPTTTHAAVIVAMSARHRDATSSAAGADVLASWRRPYTPGPLTEAEFEAYWRDGFIIKRGLLSYADLAPCLTAIERRVDEVAARLAAAGAITDTAADADVWSRLTLLEKQFPEARCGVRACVRVHACVRVCVCACARVCLAGCSTQPPSTGCRPSAHSSPVPLFKRLPVVPAATAVCWCTRMAGCRPSLPPCGATHCCLTSAGSCWGNALGATPPGTCAPRHRGA